ncbi:hypothetical protein BDI4_910069 [Burkholderia diffusa]|nr:hypothetical protein BDI4_910069 [Burkholderia diffusa]
MSIVNQVERIKLSQWASGTGYGPGIISSHGCFSISCDILERPPKQRWIRLGSLEM